MPGNNVITTTQPIGERFSMNTDNAGVIDVAVEANPSVIAPMIPLSNGRYVDVGTTVPLGSQNGSQGLPFSTLAAALASCPPNGQVFAVAGSYAAEGVLTLSKNVTISAVCAEPPGIIAEGGVLGATPQVILAGLIISPGLIVTCAHVFLVAGGPPHLTLGAGSFTILDSCEVGTVVGTGSLSIVNSFIASPSACGSFRAQNSRLGNGMTFAAAVTFVEYQDCTFDGNPVGNIAFITAGGVASLKGSSYVNWLNLGPTATVVNGTIITDQCVPLSNVKYVDLGTGTPTAWQDGDQARPYKTLTAALAAVAPDTTLLVAPGNYIPEGLLTLAKNVQIASLCPQGPAGGPTFDLLVDSISISAGVQAMLQQVILSGAGTLAIAATAVCSMYSGFVSTNVTGDGVLELRNGTAVSGNINASTIVASESFINGGIVVLTGTRCTFDECPNLPASVTFFGAPGTLNLLGESYAQWLAVGSVLNNGIIFTDQLGEIPLSNVRYVDKNTIVPLTSQNGSEGAPFSTLVAGIAATPAGGTCRVIGADYTAEGAIAVAANLTIEPAGDDVPIQMLSLTIGAGLTFNGRQITIPGASFIAVPGTSTAVLERCTTNDITGDGALTLRDCNVLDTVVCATLWAVRSALVVSAAVSGVTAWLNDCYLTAGFTLTFGAPGTLVLGGSTPQVWVTGACVVVNGRIVNNGMAASYIMSIVVPALLADTVGYLSTTTVGTNLAGMIDTNTAIQVQATTDLAAAGLAAGFLCNAYADAPDSVRCCFRGTLVGGAANFVVTVGTTP
jgi:hypothetical protein